MGYGQAGFTSLYHPLGLDKVRRWPYSSLYADRCEGLLRLRPEGDWSGPGRKLRRLRAALLNNKPSLLIFVPFLITYNLYLTKF